jgi:hypothetical protein
VRKYKTAATKMYFVSEHVCGNSEGKGVLLIKRMRAVYQYMWALCWYGFMYCSLRTRTIFFQNL